MDFPFASSDSSDDESEEAKQQAEIARQAKLARLKAEAEETSRRRRAAREDYENGRFKKVTKMEPETLTTILGKKTIFMSPEQKEEFNGMMMKVVFHFESCPGFNQIASMDDKSQLLHLIRTAHQRITTKKDSEETEENMNLHNFLVNYQKQVVSALMALTKIPKDTVIIEVESGNVFDDARRNLLERDSFKMYRDQERKRLDKEKQKMQEIVDTITAKLVSCQIGNVAGSVNLARDISNSVIREIEESAGGRSSPTRHNLSKESLECITTMCNRFKVDSAVRNLPGTTSNLEDQDFGERMDESDSDSSDDGEDGAFMMAALQDPRNHIPTIRDDDSDDNENYETMEVQVGKEHGKLYTKGTDYSCHDKNNKSPEDNAEQQENPRDEALLEEYERRINEIVEKSKAELSEKHLYYLPKDQSHPLFIEALKDWKNQQDSELPRKKKVSIAPYDSPLNTMRIFMKPNMALSAIDGCDCDDGPTHLWVDYQVKKAWQVLLNKRIKFPLIIKGAVFDVVNYARQSSLVQRLANPVQNWMIGHQGNLLGRFWYQRYPELDKENAEDSNKREDMERYQNSRNLHGVLRYVTQKDLADVFKNDWEEMRHDMHRGTFRPYKETTGNDGKIRKFRSEGWTGHMSSVLLLTDWRLAHLETQSIPNATIKFLPSQIGPVFFESMLTYLTKLLLDPNLEIRTIIFAFGGSPMFTIPDFTAFWKKVVMLTRRCVDVHWFAQDWLDGMNFDPEDMEKLNIFNAITKKAVENMNKAENMNYHWHNIREQHNIPLQPPIHYKRPDTIVLEPIYNFYVRHFANHCNVITRSSFFVTTRRKLEDHPEASSLNPQTALVYKTTHKEDDKTDEGEDYGDFSNDDEIDEGEE